MNHYVDVHTHLTHKDFATDWKEVTKRAEAAGLGAIVVNGLEPQSNRQILEMAKEFPVIRPAIGIYPLDAVNQMLPADFPHRIGRFTVDDEIAWIRETARAGKVAAIGECGLDGYYVDEPFFPKQERVFESLIEISMETNLPIIIHSRKREQRCAEILRHHGATKVNFHCFGGKSKWAIQWAEADGWWFSIPANAPRSESFQKLLSHLPAEKILTETDAPYLPFEKGTRNEPANVTFTVELLAKLRNWNVNQAKEQVWSNYQRLFTVKSIG